jgi:hypothetical protein
MPAIGTVAEIEIDAEMLAAGTRVMSVYDDRYCSFEECVANILRAVFDAKSGECHTLTLTPDALAML